jgi:hypothetical protein
MGSRPRVGRKIAARIGGVRRAGGLMSRAGDGSEYGAKLAREITQERFSEMLNVLPPCKWTGPGTVQESFHVSEFLSGNIVSWFVQINGRFFQIDDVCTLTHRELVALATACAARAEPHGLFDVWSPDTCAECLDGMSVELYKKIWNDIVPLYEDQPRSEVPDDFDRRCVAKFWDKFTDAERAELNRLAAASEVGE